MLIQISAAIDSIKEWNESIYEPEDFMCSQEGNKTLAASSMLLEAIGESFKKIDRKTNGEFLCLYPDIEWNDIIGMRNHIAHGYFDIDTDIIFDVVKNDLPELKGAIVQLQKILENL